MSAAGPASDFSTNLAQQPQKVSDPATQLELINLYNAISILREQLQGALTRIAVLEGP